MAPLPENNTPRMKVTYQNAVSTHDVIFRCAANSDFDALESAIGDFLLELTSLFNFNEVINVQTSDDGSNFFFPRTSSPLIGATWGSGPATTDSNPRFLQFGGRSVQGRRTKVYLFAYGSAVSEYRITTAESPVIADAVAVLNTNAAIFTAIDGLAAEWYPYANTKPNDYWVRKSRNG